MINCESHFNFRINPGDLHVYINIINMGNTTPAGVEQPTTLYFYKHSMPPASLLPPKNRGRLLSSVNGKETAPSYNWASVPLNVAKAFNSHEICGPSATRLPDGQEADCNKVKR